MNTAGTQYLIGFQYRTGPAGPCGLAGPCVEATLPHLRVAEGKLLLQQLVQIMGRMIPSAQAKRQTQGQGQGCDHQYQRRAGK